MEHHEAVIIGAGPAGLAVGAMLRRQGIEAVIIERADRVGSSWSLHYDRLHLHTVRWLSGLPGLRIPRAFGKWVARDDVQRYLRLYADHHQLEVRLRTEVVRLERQPHDWLLTTTGEPLSARWVVIATGFNREPFLPDWPGRDTFTGELLHSSRYRNPQTFADRTVLVVGTGNSGAEIAADLADGGTRSVWLAVRTPPNILRRDVGGFPSQVLGVLMRPLPVGLVDRMTAMVQRITVGDLSRYGLHRPPRGMYRRLVDDGIIPILDVGLIEAVKQRRVSIVAAVTGFDDADVLLADGHRLRPEAVIAATGFRRGLEPLVGAFGVLRHNGLPAVHGARTHRNAPDLYFIGYSNPLSGNLRELGFDSERIVRDIARQRGSPTAASPVPSTEYAGDQGDRDQHHHAGGGELEGALRDPRTEPVSRTTAIADTPTGPASLP
jgi:cation diffusion facilitator CzcD-associated flavoprotein CzcO